MNQINDITTTLSTPKKSTRDRDTSSKRLRVKLSGSVDLVFDETSSTSNLSNVTQPSDITTLERISDLDLVESKLNSLRHSEFETHL